MRRLYRSRYNKKLAGICGGIGNYFSIDPNLVRFAFVFICFTSLTLPALIVYFIVALIIPQEPVNSPAIHYRKFYRSSNNRIIAGICGGLAPMFKMDPTIMRLIFVAIALITLIFPLLFTYLIFWYILPQKHL